MTNTATQSFRSSTDNDIVDMDAHWDPKLQTHFVLWSQIECCFINPRFVRHGPKHIHFMLDGSYNEILPRRIPCRLGAVLEVIEKTAGSDEPSSRSPPPPLLSPAGTTSTTIPSAESVTLGPETAARKLVRLATTKRQTSGKAMEQTLSTTARSSLYVSGNLYESFLELTKHGNLDQAESIKTEFRQHFDILQHEMGENRDLQEEMKQMLTNMLDLQRETQGRLISIQKGIHAILTQTYELLEYPIPRLFIVLPRVSSRRDTLNPFTDKFRLYFLCECGEHTKTTHTNVPHHIHMAKHDGYDLDQPTEFFEKYGSYILGMLRMIKLGVSVAGYIVPPLSQLKLADGLDVMQKKLGSLGLTLESHFDSTIGHLEMLQRDKMTTPKGHNQVDHIQALEGAELRQVARFLKKRDESKVLGNLYRITTSTGHVKWVCFDHYRETYSEKALTAFAENVVVNKGEYNESTGAVKIALKSSPSAREFYGLLVKARNIQEMDISLDWDMTYSDLKQLREAMQAVNVSKLAINCGNFTGPATDAFNRGKRNDPLVHIMMNTKLLSVHFLDVDGLFSRSSVFPRKPTPLREIHIHSVFGPRSHGKNLEILLEQSPLLTSLTLSTKDEDICETLEMVRKNTTCHRYFQRLEVISRSFTIEMDATTLQSPSGTLDHSVFGSDFRTKTLALYGTQLRRLCVDDGFTDQHAQTFFIAMQRQNSWLKRLDIIISMTAFGKPRLTEEGAKTLSTIIDTSLSQDCWLHFECRYNIAHWLARMPWTIYRSDSCRLDIKESTDIKALALTTRSNIPRISPTLSRRDHHLMQVPRDHPPWLSAFFTFEISPMVQNRADNFHLGPQSSHLQHLSLKVADAHLGMGGADTVAQVIAHSPKLTKFDMTAQTIHLEDLRVVVDALDFSTLKELIFSLDEWSLDVRMVAYEALANAIPTSTTAGREGDGNETVRDRAVALEELRLRDAWGSNSSITETQTYIKKEMAKVPWCKVIFDERPSK